MKLTPSTPRITCSGINRGALIQETFAAFRSWDFCSSKQANFNRIRETNTINAPSANGLKAVLKDLSIRFNPEGVDKPLVLLAQRELSLDLWRPELLWHLAHSEYLVMDFLANWLYPRIHDGHVQFTPAEVSAGYRWLLEPNKLVKKPWSETTLQGLSSGLLRMVAAFGLLEGKTIKRAAPFHLAEPCFLYVLHAIQERGVSSNKIVEAEDWRIFLLSPQDVHQELLRLHQYRKVDYQTAGSLVELRLPAPDLLTYAEGWPL